MAGCNFKCLNCQNWEISQYPDNGYRVRGPVCQSTGRYVSPGELARECVEKLSSPRAKSMGEVVREARSIDNTIKVNFDTNGFLTEEGLERVLRLANSITYDLKAYHDSVHRAITGCPVEPVLRNARLLVKEARELLWEFRILVIPGINEADIEPLAEFIASLDPASPTAFLAFRPNFVLEDHPGASGELLDRCLSIAKKTGLIKVSSACLPRHRQAGYAGLWGRMPVVRQGLEDVYDNIEVRRAASYALAAGCHTHPRDCRHCLINQSCPLKRYQAHRPACLARQGAGRYT